MYLFYFAFCCFWLWYNAATKQFFFEYILTFEWTTPLKGALAVCERLFNSSSRSVNAIKVTQNTCLFVKSRTTAPHQPRSTESESVQHQRCVKPQTREPSTDSMRYNLPRISAIAYSITMVVRLRQAALVYRLQVTQCASSRSLFFF